MGETLGLATGEVTPSQGTKAVADGGSERQAVGKREDPVQCMRVSLKREVRNIIGAFISEPQNILL